MKKRKELDALVANGKAGKRGKKSSGSCSAHELLKHETDSSDMEDFSILNQRKSRKSGGNQISLSTICLPLCQFVLVTMCILISGTLIWLHIGLREDLDILRAHIQKVEAVNKNTPEALHTFHADFQTVYGNITVLFAEIKKNIVEIDNITQEVKNLKLATSRLQDSIDAAPALKQLPKNVKSLSENVVAFGSKISALESTVKELKDSQSAIQSTTQSLYGDLDTLKTSVHDLENVTKLSSTDVKPQTSPLVRDLTFQSAIQETKQKVSFLQNELLDLGKSVDKMNMTLSNDVETFAGVSAKVDTVNDEVISIMNDTHNQIARLALLENYTSANLTLRLEHLENECFGSDRLHQCSNIYDIQDIVNRTITEAIVRIVDSDFHQTELKLGSENSSRIIPHAQNILTLLAGLLKQMNNISGPDMLTEEKATEIVARLCSGTFHDLFKGSERSEGNVSTAPPQLVHDTTKASSPLTSIIEESTTIDEDTTSSPHFFDDKSATDS